MNYTKIITLKDGRTCILRNATEADGQALVDVFNQTHMETDFLRTYPDESDKTAESEARNLKELETNERAIEILAEVDGVITGSAGIEEIGDKYKDRHRAHFGISILKEYWGLGIGTALIQACIECAKTAGYEQIELQAVADNERAIHSYKKAGFIEYGRNPRGFKSRYTGYQEIVLMRLELEDKNNGET